MGTFNTVSTEALWPLCGSTVTLAVQFKHGWLGLDAYEVGDVLDWSGDPSMDAFGRMETVVVVQGLAEACPRCRGETGLEFEVVVEADVIVGVRRRELAENRSP